MLRTVFTFLFFTANLNISPTFAVTGGEPVKPHEFPFLVSFYIDGTWNGLVGALIGPRHVLTCKHCFEGKEAELIEVGFGKTVRDNDEGVLKRQVQRVVFHPTLDFAILVLGAEAPLSEHVKLIGLSEAGSDFSGQNATLAGPGALGPDWDRTGNCQGDSWGPSVSFLRPWIDREMNKKSPEITSRAERPMW